MLNGRIWNASIVKLVTKCRLIKHFLQFITKHVQSATDTVMKSVRCAAAVYHVVNLWQTSVDSDIHCRVQLLQWLHVAVGFYFAERLFVAVFFLTVTFNWSLSSRALRPNRYRPAIAKVRYRKGPGLGLGLGLVCRSRLQFKRKRLFVSSPVHPGPLR